MEGRVVEVDGDEVGKSTLPEVSALVTLLQDVVDDGASVGFLPPLGTAAAEAYWWTVVAALRNASRVLRAEVAKLMVPTTARRRGIGRRLMLAIEAEARRRGRTTLVLDTRQGDPSEPLYHSLGWTCFGVVPRYAESAGGRLEGSAFYYRLLETS